MAGAISADPGPALSIAANTSVALATSPVVLSSLSLLSNAVLDVRDKQLTIRNADANALAAQIVTGRNGGSWNGAGIVTSMPDAQGSTASKTLGVKQIGTDVQIAYTFAGDATLDGVIDGDDFFAIDAGFLAGGTTYAAGDFNYSGNVDADDYFLINANYNKSQPAEAPPAPAASAAYEPNTPFSASPIEPRDDELIQELL
jgi:hypothetical protein